ncbi:MAG TPA: lipoprotein insertase outer membrane protein LolB [Lysobacter sp.]|nr:lipoprotein insertase outer membrane protein LolB [Lysobacter sp.]
MPSVVRYAALAAMMTIALTACVTRPVRTVLPELSAAQRAEAEATQKARETKLRAQSGWSLSGRIAVSTGSKGGSGRIDWSQQGANYEVALSAPVTRQSWKLSGNTTWARLEGLEGGPREGADAAQLLHETTGWDIPVIALADWVRGVRSEALGTAAVRYGADHRLAQLEQGGWIINYAWPEGGAIDALPLRLDAARNGAKVRLLIDEWGASQ